jgi:hypothetical protein
MHNERVQQLFDEFPEACNLDPSLDRACLRQKIEIGELEIAAGRTTPHEIAKRWLAARFGWAGNLNDFHAHLRDQPCPPTRVHDHARSGAAVRHRGREAGLPTSKKPSRRIPTAAGRAPRSIRSNRPSSAPRNTSPSAAIAAPGSPLAWPATCPPRTRSRGSRAPGHRRPHQGLRHLRGRRGDEER